MVNRQDVPYSQVSPEIGRHPLAAEIISDGTKLALEGSRPKTTTESINCSFQLYSLNQNRAESRPSQPETERVRTQLKSAWRETSIRIAPGTGRGKWNGATLERNRRPADHGPLARRL